jgi:hypothetical protein
MMSTIRMFESSRPENLLLFSKVFLALNTDRKYVDKPAICSTTLMKYVVDKWVNVLPKLRRQNALNKRATAYYSSKVLGRCLTLWRERLEHKNAEQQLT